MSDYLVITLITLPDSDTGMETRTRIPNLLHYGSWTLLETDLGTDSNSDSKPKRYIVACRACCSLCTHSNSNLTPYFCIGQEYASESVPVSESSFVSKPLEWSPFNRSFKFASWAMRGGHLSGKCGILVSGTAPLLFDGAEKTRLLCTPFVDLSSGGNLRFTIKHGRCKILYFTR